MGERLGEEVELTLGLRLREHVRRALYVRLEVGDGGLGAVLERLRDAVSRLEERGSRRGDLLLLGLLRRLELARTAVIGVRRARLRLERVRRVVREVFLPLDECLHGSRLVLEREPDVRRDPATGDSLAVGTEDDREHAVVDVRPGTREVVRLLVVAESDEELGPLGIVGRTVDGERAELARERAHDRDGDLVARLDLRRLAVERNKSSGVPRVAAHDPVRGDEEPDREEKQRTSRRRNVSAEPLSQARPPR